MATITELLKNPVGGNPTGLLPLLQQEHGDSFERYNVSPWSFNTTRLNVEGDGGWRLQSPTPISGEQGGRWNIIGTTWTLWIGKTIPFEATMSYDEWQIANIELHGQIQQTISRWCNCQAPNLPGGQPRPGSGVLDRKADTSTGRANAIRQYQILAWSIENLNVAN